MCPVLLFDDVDKAWMTWSSAAQQWLLTANTMSSGGFRSSCVVGLEGKSGLAQPRLGAPPCVPKVRHTYLAGCGVMVSCTKCVALSREEAHVGREP